ncbi:MAG: DUF6932 family protein [Thermomicrobiales bacterium]
MIPSFEASGNLPPGVHAATWEEFVARYGSTPHRLALLAGLKAALDALRAAGCARVYLDGSFVTAKATPGDFDGCWEVAGVDPDLLDPVLLVFANQRAAQKAKYGGELFPAETTADPFGTRFLEFFQRDKRTGDPKGIIAIDLGGVP